MTMWQLFIVLLTILFIYLKLAGFVFWGWFFVLLPAIVYLVFGLIYAFFEEKIVSWLLR